MVADRIKQTLLCESIPTYKWMYDLGLNSTQLGVYAYIFNVCRHEPMREHHILTQDLAKTFGVTVSGINYTVNSLTKLGLLSKRIEGKGNQSKPYYSLFQPV
jgi:DNA-binding MarR family transcriptional regulator